LFTRAAHVLKEAILRKLILAAAAMAFAVPAAASAQSSPSFPEEMDEEIVRSLPHPAEVEAMADVAGRAAEAVIDVPIGGVIQAIDPTRRVRRDDTIADVSRDPYLRDRIRDSVDDVAIGMGDVMAQVAVVAPALRRSLADLERNLDRAIYDARRGRDRDYYDDYEYRRR
jgi:hypothetical protein